MNEMAKEPAFFFRQMGVIMNEVMLKVGESIVQNFGGAIKTAVEILQFLQEDTEGTMDFTSQIFAKVGHGIAGVFKFVGAVILETMGTIFNLLGKLPGVFGDVLAGMGETAKQWSSTTWDSMGASFTGMMDSFTVSAPPATKSIEDLVNAFKGFSPDAPDGPVAGIKAAKDAMHEFMVGLDEDMEAREDKYQEKTIEAMVLGDLEQIEKIKKGYEEAVPVITSSVKMLGGAFGQVQAGLAAIGVKGGGGFGVAMKQIAKVQAIISAAQTIRELALAASDFAGGRWAEAAAHLAAAAGHQSAEAAGKKAEAELGAASGGGGGFVAGPTGATQHKAGGGIIAGPSGLDAVPVMATAGEGFLTPQTTKSIISELTGQAAAPAGGGATNNFYFTVEGDALDAEGLVAKTIPAMEKAMAEQTFNLQPGLAR
jgi:hypothetical protein